MQLLTVGVLPISWCGLLLSVHTTSLIIPGPLHSRSPGDMLRSLLLQSFSQCLTKPKPSWESVFTMSYSNNHFGGNYTIHHCLKRPQTNKLNLGVFREILHVNIQSQTEAFIERKSAVELQ